MEKQGKARKSNEKEKQAKARKSKEKKGKQEKANKMQRKAGKSKKKQGNASKSMEKHGKATKSSPTAQVDAIARQPLRFFGACVIQKARHRSTLTRFLDHTGGKKRVTIQR